MHKLQGLTDLSHDIKLGRQANRAAIAVQKHLQSLGVIPVSNPNLGILLIKIIPNNIAMPILQPVKNLPQMPVLILAQLINQDPQLLPGGGDYYLPKLCGVGWVQDLTDGDGCGDGFGQGQGFVQVLGELYLVFLLQLGVVPDVVLWLGLALFAHLLLVCPVVFGLV